MFQKENKDKQTTIVTKTQQRRLETEQYEPYQKKGE